ncbi:glycosyl transferase [Bacillus sp. J14TS2]|uniref:glycosyltransferase n=1 Tax=Bacillus sp. J14TS2 TaxID=2807188 RepID=UPI001B0220B9|nr:glycosyltransferase [Bacillus sp. J14TS2]GIN73213.1 glycosyl transferase [Bacillus sp. J14TS2]
MKKSLLFVIDSLECAGAEKSLVTLLSLLDYSRYSVDLLLFSHGGALEEIVPKDVNLLPPLKYTLFSKTPLKKAFIQSMKHSNGRMLVSRIKYSVRIRGKKYTNPQKARIFWQAISKVIEDQPKKYDIAISYAQGIPTFYVAEKVAAKKKYAWVNASYSLEAADKEFQKKYYQQFNNIVAVSDYARDILAETFPEFRNHMKVIYDMINPLFIANMIKIGDSYNDDFTGIKILTIGRFSAQKGYELAIEACARLRDTGVHFKWYVLGKGPLEKEIRQMIAEKGLSEHFILLGVKANPYPFIKDADIYVQTSRVEGFGLAITEARILNIPVVTTRFAAACNQMIDKKNGLVVDIDAKAICQGILNLITDKPLQKDIIAYLEAEKKGNIEEIEKFYQLINGD